MGCGCKNKQNTQTTTTQQSSKTPTQQVQEAIKKTVEKYYVKK